MQATATAAVRSAPPCAGLTCLDIAIAIAAVACVARPVLAQDYDGNPQINLNQRTLQGCFFNQDGVRIDLSVVLDNLKYRNGSSHQIWVKPESHKLLVSPPPGGRITNCTDGVFPNFAGVAVIGGGNQGGLSVLCEYKYPPNGAASYTAAATLEPGGADNCTEEPEPE